MKIYLIALAAGLLVGVIYGLLNVRSPAPPIVALVSRQCRSPSGYSPDSGSARLRWPRSAPNPSSVSCPVRLATRRPSRSATHDPPDAP
jgi:hypothetical protein